MKASDVEIAQLQARLDAAIKERDEAIEANRTARNMLADELYASQGACREMRVTLVASRRREARAIALVKEVLSAGVECEDARIRYKTIQLDKTWFEEAAAMQPDADGATTG